MTTKLNNQNRQNKPDLKIRLAAAANAMSFALPKPKFFIEKAVVLYDEVHVIYMPEAALNASIPSDDDWQEASIKRQLLEAFVAKSFSLTSGYQDYNLSMWVDENINHCVKAYLEAGEELVK